MSREIDEQPTTLASAYGRYPSQLAPLRSRDFDSVLLVARGSSDHAALYGRYLIEIHLGIPAILAAPSVLTRYHRRIRLSNALVVGLSQSGAAPDVAEVLTAMREEGHETLAITNTPHSRITRAAQHTLLLEVGDERSVAATKTYSASLLALYELARVVGADLPGPRIPDEKWLGASRNAAAKAAPTVLAGRPLFALARGYRFASALECGLKLMECALLPCIAYSSADFEHGPKALAGPGATIIRFGPGDDALERQGAAVVDAPEPPCPPEFAPLWDAIFLQLLALECARASGHDPDAPRFLQKVTETR